MILVTGAGGQLGQELKQALRGREALFLGSGELDITDAEACRRAVAENGVTVIINAAAYTKVDKAEDERERALAVNGQGPLNLARAAHETGARVVQVSTDYVFDGRKRSPYGEDDAPNPLTVYGRSKLAGEDAVLDHAPRAWVVRTGWLYSAHGHNFMKTMLRLGREKSEISVVDDQRGTPTHAAHLARALAQMPDVPGESGIFHYADEGEASWYDFATRIMQIAGLPCRVNPIATSAYPTPALRPAYSVLDKARVKSAFRVETNDWQDGVAACVKALQN